MSPPKNRFSLDNQSGGLGLECGLTGLRLAGVPLLNASLEGLSPRPREEISALLVEAYESGVDEVRIERGLWSVAKAINERDIGRAMIAAVQLKLPELSWARAVKIAQLDDKLRKYSPDEPRDWRGRWTVGDATAQPNGASQTPVSAGKLPEPRSPGPASQAPGNIPLKPSSNNVDSPIRVDSASAEVNPDTLTDIDYMGRFHDLAVAKYVAYLISKGEIVQTEVRLKMADGSAGARLDILARDPRTGILYGVEVKTGENPWFSKGQLLVYPHLMMGGSVIALDNRVVATGVPPRVPLPPIPIYQYYQRNAESAYKVNELDPTKMSRYYRGER